VFRILRTFAWLHWRMFINSLEKTGARDTVERFSLAIEKLGPIMAAVLMVPSGLLLAAGATASGFALARGDHESLFFEAARYLLLAVPVFGIVGPILLPAADRTNPVRLLLLPIPRSTLYAAQTSSAFGDVWVLVMLPFVLFLPIGLLAGGAFAAALVALVGGALLVLVVIGISSLTTSLLHLVVRNRRRGELLALLFIVLIPALSTLPGLLAGGRHRARADGRTPETETVRIPAWVTTVGDRVISLYPSELYVKSARVAAHGEVRASGAFLFGLVATGLLLHGVGMFVFARVLDSPGSTGARRAVPMRAAWGRTLPGLSPGASAVALAQLRLALRTPRGRAILLSPLVMIAVFGVVMRRHSGGMDFGPWALNSGVSLAVFGSFICLMSILPIAMNQFAVDKAGLTLALLSPLTDGEYLAGKAVGNALIAAGPAALALVLSFVAFPGGSLALWLAIPLALLATYFLVAPAAAIFSALFPRVVDLNSIGRGSNAHGLAGLLGILCFAGAGAPGLLITLAASKWLGRPSLVPVLLLAWCAIAYGIGRLLFVPARRIFARRRENLAMMM
jgi:hypothetical protein